MELVSLSCNRDFTSALSYGLGWYKYAIATHWYQFHTTDAWCFSLNIVIWCANLSSPCVSEPTNNWISMIWDIICVHYVCMVHMLLSFLTHWGQDKMDAIFKCIFLNENVWIPIKISLKFVPKGPINNIPALVEIMAWRRPGDKPLSEPMMVSLPTHICITRP